MKTIQEIIDYMEATPEDSWLTGYVRATDQRNCFFGHLFNMEQDQKEANHLWNWFEEMYATTYMIYPVNDGEAPEYQQPTPRQRVIAYLKDLRDGNAKTTHQLMDEYHAEDERKNEHVFNVKNSN